MRRRSKHARSDRHHVPEWAWWLGGAALLLLVADQISGAAASVTPTTPILPS
jgi:hypothetical protein